MTIDLYPQPDDPKTSDETQGETEYAKDFTPQEIKQEPRLKDSNAKELKSARENSEEQDILSAPSTAILNSASPLQTSGHVEVPSQTDIQDIGIHDGPIASAYPDTSSPQQEAEEEIHPLSGLPETKFTSMPEADASAIQTIAQEPKGEDSPTRVTKSFPFPPFQGKHRTTLWLFVPILLATLAGFILSALYPEMVALISRALTTIIIVVFIIFIVIGVLIVIGLKDQARGLLSLIFEGGFRYINFAQSLSEIWETVVRIVQEFILLISPFFAIFLAIIFYYIAMFSFRAVGAHNDVTLFAIIMTILLSSITAGLGQIKIAEAEEATSFKSQLSIKFSRVFIDSIEIAVLVIFLTIDAKKLFFLPVSLQTPLQANMFGIDFMKRGITGAGFSTTFRIAGAAVFVEVVRKTYRIAVSVFTTYRSLHKANEENGRPTSSQKEAFDILRKALSIAFKKNVDDLMKFLGFTTILIIGFFLFPRLKLLSLLFFNLTSLAWDLIIPSRATRKARSEDLLSRSIAKVLKL